MTIEDALNLLDHEVMVRVRPNGSSRKDIVLWSPDWIMQKYLPVDLKKYLKWRVDDVCAEMTKDPETGKEEPTVVLCAYECDQDPTKVFVLEQIRVFNDGYVCSKCRSFLERKSAESAMRDAYDAEWDACGLSDFEEVVKDECHCGDCEAVILFKTGTKVIWEIYATYTQDAEYR